METAVTTQIEKQVTLNAPIGRVWNALTEAHQFGAWFGVKFTGRFGPKLSLVGELTDPGNIGRKMCIRIAAMEPQHYFAWRWRPHALDRPIVDDAETTLVEFFLTAEGDSTRLRVLESGFDRIPESVRASNYRDNSDGWAEQAGRLSRYLEGDGPIPDEIRKQVNIKAPIERVWQAVSRAEEFGKWFGIDFAGAQFVAGKPAAAKITEPPEYAGTEFTISIVEMDAPRLLSFRWHPYAIEAGTDYSQEPTTLIEFMLEPSGSGTRLTIIESGFQNIPEDRRATAFRSNDEGWGIQADQVRKYVDG